MIENNLKMYMVHDGEAAVLVFARTAREATRIANLPWGDGDSEQFMARRAKWLREPEFTYLRALARELVPHTVDSLPVCRSCELWGTGPIGEDGRCAACAEGGM